MIAKLTGYLDSMGEDWVIIDVQGVGYWIYCSLRTQKFLKEAEDRMVSLAVETLIRDERIYLYGFTNMIQRDWFRLLMTVQGVGARAALSLLEVLSCEELCYAIISHDHVALLRAEGIGTRLAKRILLELKEKVDKIPSFSQESQSMVPTVCHQALLALVNLGYTRSEAYKVVTEVCAQNPSQDIATLLRYSLQRLGQNERRA